MPLIEANGARLHVQQLGPAGSPVLMLHGVLLDSLATWYFTIAPRLASTHRVHLLDWRGHGRSEPAEDGYSLTGLARDVAGVSAELGLEQPALVGFSYGGAVALRYAADHPEDVSRLVLVDTPLPVVGATGLQWLERPLDHQPAERWLQVLPERQRALLTTGRRARLLHGQVSRLYDRTSLRAEVASEPDVPDAELARITAPTLLVYGARSWYGHTRERLERVLPDVRSVELDAGHFVPVEAPEALGAAVAAFLRG